jgi:hypothetical protein
LEVVCLTRCRNISDDGLYNLAELSPSLRELDIRGFSRLPCNRLLSPNAKLPSALASLTRLPALRRCCITGAGVARMCTRTPELRALWVSGCDAMTDTGMARAMLLCSVCPRIVPPPRRRAAAPPPPLLRARWSHPAGARRPLTVSPPSSLQPPPPPPQGLTDLQAAGCALLTATAADAAAGIDGCGGGGGGGRLRTLALGSLPGVPSQARPRRSPPPRRPRPHRHTAAPPLGELGWRGVFTIQGGWGGGHARTV